MKNFLSLLLSFSCTFLFAQNIVVEYKNPTQMSLCDTAIFTIIAKNTDTKTATNSEVYIELPLGFSYVKNSVTNGTEKTLTSNRIFDFNFGDVAGKTSKTLTFKAFADCSALTELNKGVLFTNLVIIRYGANEAAIETDPILLESPLPIIVSMTDPYMKGGKGDILERTIVIENTRFGSLRTFTFEDNHQGGMLVSSLSGKTILSNLTQLHLLFGAADFKKIGDGDALFENGEQIIIKEKILVTDCGDLFPKSTSKFNIVWGCPGQVCNTERFTAVVDILRTTSDAKLKLEGFYDIARDFYGIKPEIQGMKIKNTGKDTAYNVRVQVRQIDIHSSMDRGSFTLKNGNNTSKITPISFVVTAPKSCQSAVPTDSIDVLMLPNVPPGQEMILKWNYFTCAPECNVDVQHRWLGNVFYQVTCPVAMMFSDSIDVIQEHNNPAYFSVFSKLAVLKDNGTIDAQMVFALDKFADSTGTANFKLTLPCGVKWTSGAMNVGSNIPLTFDIQDVGANQVITGSYKLPFKDSIFGVYNLKFNCDPNCQKGADFYNIPISSCTDFLPLKPFYQTDKQTAKSECFIKSFEGAGIGIKRCDEYLLDYDCTKNSTKFDTLKGYTKSEVRFDRSNLGLPDNDNDRVADTNGTIDLTKINRHHFTVGDTADFSIKSQIVAENGKDTFRFAKINITFEKHIIDIDLKKYGTPLIDNWSNTSFISLGAKLVVFNKKSNQYYNCTLPNYVFTQDSVNLRYLNTAPILIQDDIFRLFHTYTLDAKTLVGLPPNYIFSNEDSILVSGKYYVNLEKRNIGKQAARAKSLRFNAGVSVYQDVNTPNTERYCAGNEIRFHVTTLGVVQSYPKYPLLDCQPTTNSSLVATFGVVREYPNFFPYEFRTFGKIPKLYLRIADSLIYVSAKAKTWKTQGGQTHFTNQNIPIATVGVNSYELDLSAFQIAPQDEGFTVEIENTFQSQCFQKLKDKLITIYPIEQSLPILLKDTIGYSFPPKSGIPVFSLNYNQLTVSNLYDEYNSFDNTALWELAFGNPSQYTTPNPYLYFSNAKGVQDIKVFNKATGAEILPQNGLYYLPDVAPNGAYNIQILGINNTCDEAKIDVNYGWNCTKVNAIAEKSCSEKKYTLYVSPTPGEIELRIENPTDTTKMCEPVGYFNIDVLSVRFGSVFNPTVKLNLPSGLSVQPNSCQVAYPANSGNFVNVADPQTITGGGFGWNMADLVKKIQQNGLAGIASKPNNTVRLRFKMLTKCGFSAGKNFTAKIEGFEICGKKTNELTRASKPIFLQGVTPLYTTKILFKPLYAGLLKCDQEAKFSIRAVPNGYTGNKDSIYVYLPLHVQYLKYDIVNNNSPTTPPIEEIIGNQRVMKWKIPQGVGPGAYIGIVIYTKGWGRNSCKGDEILVKTVQRQETTCVANGELCSVSNITGESNSLTIAVAHPSYEITSAVVSYKGFSLDYNINVKNLSSADSVKGMILDLYADVNNNQIFDKGTDLFLGNTLLDVAFPNGKTQVLIGKMPVANIENYLCNLLIVIDKDQNCGCQTVSFPIKNIQVDKGKVSACSTINTPIGLNTQPGYTYNWLPAQNLSCTDCAKPNFLFTNNTNSNADFLFNLVAKKGDCTANVSQAVTVFPKSKITTIDPAICKGGSIDLTTTQGSKYNWSGAGITTPDLQTQNVKPTATSWYKVTVTDANSCVGIDSVLVKVGGGNGAKKDTICQGKKIILNNVTYTKSGVYDVKYKIGANCDSTLVFTLTVLDTPIVKIDTIKVVVGQEVILQAPNGFASYLWIPSKGLSCNNCQNPKAKPTQDTSYVLIVKTSGGCQASARAAITILPNCEIEGIKPCLVFTPDGDIPENKMFRFTGLDRSGITVSLTIFNRWGEIIKEEISTDPRWDGMFKDNPAPTDVYIIRYELLCGENNIVKPMTVQEVTLLR